MGKVVNGKASTATATAVKPKMTALVGGCLCRVIVLSWLGFGHEGWGGCWAWLVTCYRCLDFLGAVRLPGWRREEREGGGHAGVIQSSWEKGRLRPPGAHGRVSQDRSVPRLGLGSDCGVNGRPAGAGEASKAAVIKEGKERWYFAIKECVNFTPKDWQSTA